VRKFEEVQFEQIVTVSSDRVR